MLRSGRFCQYLEQQRLPPARDSALCWPVMTEKQTWIITGAGRGLGVDIAKAALAAGHNVVATGRNPETVATALGDAEDLLVVALDVTDPEQIAEEAVESALERFGRSTCWSTTRPASTRASSKSSRRSRCSASSR